MHDSLGALGPARSFSPGQLYGNLLWFFLIGPVLVALTWLGTRRWSVLRWISWPVIFGGMTLVPPATGVNFSSWWLVNMTFNGVIRRKKPAWWIKYSKTNSHFPSQEVITLCRVYLLMSTVTIKIMSSLLHSIAASPCL
jgi:hypothetical protein